MFDSVDYVRSVCERNGVPVSKLEKDCGFSNGYLNPKKLKKIPYDRAIVIAEYLSRFEPITVEYIMTGKEKAPTPEGGRGSGDPIFTYAMNGEVDKLTPERKEMLRGMAQYLIDQQAKEEQEKGRK